MCWGKKKQTGLARSADSNLLRRTLQERGPDGKTVLQPEEKTAMEA